MRRLLLAGIAVAALAAGCMPSTPDPAPPTTTVDACPVGGGTGCRTCPPPAEAVSFDACADGVAFPPYDDWWTAPADYRTCWLPEGCGDTPFTGLP